MSITRLAAGVALAALLAHGIGAGRAIGQAPASPTPTAVPTTSPTPAPLPDLSGTWSVTRWWWRSCPGCSQPVVRTAGWVISQSGAGVRIDRGLRGTLLSGGPEGALLNLEGLESLPDSVLRFAYSSLRVSASGDHLSGTFAGSERLPNPCGSSPPIVTCLVSAGVLDARRLDHGPTPTPTSGAGTPIVPTAAVSTTGTATREPPVPGTPTGTPAPTRNLTPTSAATGLPSGTATPTPAPVPRGYLPLAGR